MQATQANPQEVKRIFTYGLPYTNHHAGGLWFGPVDKYLYYPLGDGGSEEDPWNNGQRLNLPLGKMMRLDIDTPPGRADFSLKQLESLVYCKSTNGS
jgi:glucose/arabinose dehydrogenase